MLGGGNGATGPGATGPGPAWRVGAGIGAGGTGVVGGVGIALDGTGAPPNGGSGGTTGSTGEPGCGATGGKKAFVSFGPPSGGSGDGGGAAASSVLCGLQPTQRIPPRTTAWNTRKTTTRSGKFWRFLPAFSNEEPEFVGGLLVLIAVQIRFDSLYVIPRYNRHQ